MHIWTRDGKIKGKKILQKRNADNDWLPPSDVLQLQSGSIYVYTVPAAWSVHMIFKTDRIESANIWTIGDWEVQLIWMQQVGQSRFS